MKGASVIRAMDDLLVFTALAASAGYAVLALGPKSLRSGFWAALAATAEQVRLRRLAQRWRASAQRSTGACGGCDSCATTAEPAPDGHEVRVPLAKIGTRRTNRG